MGGDGVGGDGVVVGKADWICGAGIGGLRNTHLEKTNRRWKEMIKCTFFHSSLHGPRSIDKSEKRMSKADRFKGARQCVPVSLNIAATHHAMSTPEVENINTNGREGRSEGVHKRLAAERESPSRGGRGDRFDHEVRPLQSEGAREGDGANTVGICVRPRKRAKNFVFF